MRWADSNDEVVMRRMAAEDNLLVEPASRYGDALRGYVRINLSMNQPVFDQFLHKIQQQPNH